MVNPFRGAAPTHQGVIFPFRLRDFQPYIYFYQYYGGQCFSLLVQVLMTSILQSRRGRKETVGPVYSQREPEY